MGQVCNIIASMSKAFRTMQREKKTIAAMIDIYCRHYHCPGDNQLCPECADLLEYANKRLDNCPFGPDKGPCSKCDVHCYKPELRDRIREVMRFAGPKMITKHPILAMDHLIKSVRSTSG